MVPVIDDTTSSLSAVDHGISASSDAQPTTPARQ
jgi:hypothetical protein